MSQQAPRLLLLALCLVLRASDRPREAAACGGPDYGDLLALSPYETQLVALERPGYDFELREELSFAYPLARQRPAELGAVTEFLTGGTPNIALPTLQGVQEALARGDLDAATRAATAGVDAVYALPPVLAASVVRTVLWPALEVIELAAAPGVSRREALAFLDRKHPLDVKRLSPRLRAALDARGALETGTPLLSGRDNPRAPSLGFVAFQRAFAERVPNGYVSEIRSTLQGPVWSELEASVDAWIHANPRHPLIDLASLWKVRIHHFSGAHDAAWSTALSVWPRRPVRATAEMAFLLATDGPPSEALVDSLDDPLLIAALAGKVPIDPKRHAKWWRLSMQRPDAPWSIALQERLLLAVAKRDRLPPDFPERDDAPTPLWGKLRAFALARAHREGDALRQLERLPPDAETARLAVKLHLARKQPEKALAVPQVSEDVRTYVIKVRLDQPSLERLAAGSDPELRAAAETELSLYAARRNDWNEAARLSAHTFPERSAAFREAARLASAATPEHDLALARFLTQHTGALLSPSLAFYRGLGEVAEQQQKLGTADPVYLRIVDAMLRSSEHFRALELYCRWLARNPNQPNARAVLAEADQAYSRLLNQGGSDHYFFGKYAPTSRVAIELRRIGKLIRSRA